MKSPRPYRLLLNAVGILGFFGGWMMLSWNSTNLFFPPLTRMLFDAYDYWASSHGLKDIISTIGNFSEGLVLGVTAGALAGLAVGQIGWLNRSVTPLIEFVRSIPQVALIPFAISLFGIGNGMKVFIVALTVFWPILLNVSEGIRHLPRQWLDTGAAFGLKPIQAQYSILLPALLPRLLTGIHVALPLSLIVAVTSEMVGQSVGIGATILDAQYTFNIPRMWSGVLVLGTIGCLLNLAFALLEASVARWRYKL